VERDTFDRLARLFGAAGSRRDAVRLVVTGALLGGATTIAEGAAKRRRRKGRRLLAQQVADVPAICLVTGGTGCGQPQGNCANKRIGPGANLTNCNFVTESGGIFQTNFAASNLTGTCWLAAELFNQPNFRGANLTNACFFETDLHFANFRSTNVRGASFCDADLTGVDFRGSNVTAAQIACAATVSCSTILPNGKPAVPCAAGETCCIDVCVDLENDDDNCGACFNVCEPPANCEQGSCGVG
jgi:hypothetical protein